MHLLKEVAGRGTTSMACRAGVVKLCWAMSHREQPPPAQVPPQLSPEDLRVLLEAQLDRQLGPANRGCWPLLIALLGIALGVGLLLR